MLLLPLHTQRRLLVTRNLRRRDWLRMCIFMIQLIAASVLNDHVDIYYGDRRSGTRKRGRQIWKGDTRNTVCSFEKSEKPAGDSLRFKHENRNWRRV